MYLSPDYFWVDSDQCNHKENWAHNINISMLFLEFNDFKQQ